MTRADYENYVSAVSAFMEREGLANLSSTDGETFISSRPCECCGDPLQGEREECNGYNPTAKQIQTYTVCTDCVYFAEYGQLPDAIMAAIED